MTTKAERELDQLAAETPELERRAARAARAKNILEDEMFKNAVRAVRDELVKNLTSGKPEKIGEVRLMYDGLEKIVQALHTHMSDGTLARFRLEEIKSRKSFLERLRAA